MSRSQPEVVVGLGADRACWTTRGEARSGDHGELVQALRELPASTRVRVVAGLDLAVHWLQAPPAAVQSMQELRLVAAARCVQLYGGAVADWWVAGDWSASQPFPCAALPRAAVQALQESIDAAGLDVTWETAWGSLCERSAAIFPANGWSALRTPGKVLLWHCADGAVRTMATVAARSNDEADAAVARQMQIEALHDRAFAAGPVHWFPIEADDEADAALRAGAVA